MTLKVEAEIATRKYSRNKVTTIREQLKERFNDYDLDEHVIELKLRDASNINNAGIDAQIAYLISEGGESWLAELLAEEERE